MLKTGYNIRKRGAFWQEILSRKITDDKRIMISQASTNLVTGFNLILGPSILATPPVNSYMDDVSGVGMKFHWIKVE